MAAAISGLPSTPTTTSSTVGAKTLSSSDFLNLMIQQLSQQDPLNPTDSNQLLTQMSQISTLQSNTDMQTSLAGLTLQQSIGAGGNLIGKSVTGLDPNGNTLQGIVTSIKVNDKQVYLELDSGSELPMGNVTQIAPTGATSASALPQSLQQVAAQNNATSSSTSALSSLLAALRGGSGTTPSNLSTLLSGLSGVAQ